MNRVNKVAKKTEQDALKIMVKDKNNLTIRYKKKNLKYDLDKFLTWTKTPLGNSDSSNKDIVRTLVFSEALKSDIARLSCSLFCSTAVGGSWFSS